ncbi:MAG TPA: molybdopterin-dependent oxidoreductase [Vicinamibacterales bacterium]|jgi:anaerobic selenocysteine-containing dehydrogenase/Fe-S-cluster-containing dehydrogenase component
MVEVHRTVCPRNCYCTCGMLVTVDDGRMTRIEGDPLNPATGGHVCLKGLSYARRLTTAQRLLHPLRRTSGGDFERVTWTEALDDIAARLGRLRDRRGPESVLYYDGSGSHGALSRLSMAFWHQFGGCTLAYGDLCWPAGLEATRLTYGANLHNHPRSTIESRFILLWGHNPAETNVHQMRLIHEAQERGATIALVDPRSTDTSDAVDIHLQPRPGTDAALALGVARVIVDAGLHDQRFLDAHAAGVDRYLARLAEYPLDRVASITGVPAAAIEELALALAQTKPALLIAGFGLQRHHRAGQTMRAVALLPALTGNIGVPGGGWQYANLNSHCLVDPPLPPEPEAIRRAFPMSRLGPGLMALEAPRVAAAWIEKANPASQNPRANLVRDALASLDLLVVVDQFMTDTARLAHYVLPAKTMFEEEDLVTAYWHPYLQLRTKIFDPPGDVKTETEIWRLLCERFGLDTSYFPRDAREIRRLLEGMLPDTQDRPGTLDAARSPIDELQHGPWDPTGRGDVAFADLSFATPSGKIEFASEEAERRWGVAPVPDYEPLDEGHEAASLTRFPLQLLSCKTRDRIHSQFGNLDWLREVERPHRLDMHPDDARGRGLNDGDRAVVWNSRGRVELVVRLDEGLRPGVVHVLEGRCHDGDPDINVLTDAGVTDMNHGATFYECLVQVSRGDGHSVPSNAPGTSHSVSISAPGTSHSALSSAPGTQHVAPSTFLLDLHRCLGCGACVLACRLENGWPSSAPWRRVLPLNLRRRPGGPTYFFSVACHHCDRPACVTACPSGAYEKRADGVVVHHDKKCLGCRYCEMACPFGAPRYDAERGVMAKCDLCHHRLDAGVKPACVVACPTEALRLVQPGQPGESMAPAGAPVPGFADPAGCRPNLRFLMPRGRRASLLKALRSRLSTLD